MSSSYVCRPQSKEVYLKLLTRNTYICSLQFIKLLNDLLHVSCAHVYTRVYTITNISTCIRGTICYNNVIRSFADAWGLRKNKSRKTGFLRDCLLFLHPLVVSLSLFLFVLLESVHFEYEQMKIYRVCKFVKHADVKAQWWMHSAARTIARQLNVIDMYP